MFELSGVNYEEVLEQGDSILVRVIASSSYRGFELSGLYCIQYVQAHTHMICKHAPMRTHAPTHACIHPPDVCTLMPKIYTNTR